MRDFDVCDSCCSCAQRAKGRGAGQRTDFEGVRAASNPSRICMTRSPEMPSRSVRVLCGFTASRASGVAEKDVSDSAAKEYGVECS